MRTLISNPTIVNGGEQFRGSIVVNNGRIAEILRGDELPRAECDEVIEATGLYLIPGVIDTHVHFREPGLTHKATIATESRAAAAGGVTSYMEMPNTVPQTTTIKALKEKNAIAAKESIINYSFFFGATNSNCGDFAKLNPKRVCGIKLFMGSSTGNMLVDQMETLKNIFANAGMLIATHCEDQHIISANTAQYKEMYGEDPDVKYHPAIRNEEACYQSSALAVQLAKETGARLHIMHISTAKELTLLENKPIEEKNITAEACVSHLFFCDEDYERFGARIKCNPAIKSKADRDALRQALTDNLIDVIGTDHAPHLLSEKQGGALKAVSGMPTLQFSLNSVMELVHEGLLSIEQLVQKMCHAPATLYQIEKRGFIRPGYQADVVLLNPSKEWTVTNECILSKCGWSPMEGQTFHSKVEKTFVNGHLVYTDNQVDEAHRGQALRFCR